MAPCHQWLQYQTEWHRTFATQIAPGQPGENTNPREEVPVLRPQDLNKTDVGGS